MRRAAAILTVAASLALAPPALAGTVTVTNVSPLTATEGTPATLTWTFTDTNGVAPSKLKVSISWGDGTPLDTSSGTITEIGGPGGTTYTGAATHSMAEEGQRTVAVIVGEKANPANTGTSVTSTAVADAPLTAIAGTPEVLSGHGASGTAASTAAFEAGIGGARNTAPAEQTGGFRQVNWDGVPLDGSDPGSTTIAPGHVIALAHDREQAQGLELTAPLAVSDDGFVSVNPSAASHFPAFSGADIAAPFNSNQLRFEFTVPSDPGTAPVAQGTRGFGLVLLNEQQADTTSVQLLNGDNVLATLFAPAGGSGQPSFVGALFSAPVITRVIVTLGAAEIFNFDGTTATAGPPATVTDLVAADDAVFAEPATTTPGISATAGVPFSGTVDTFADGDPNGVPGDYTTSIDWGDGTDSAGTVTAASGGGFAVGANHRYAHAGTYDVTVTETDFGGARRIVHLAATVAAGASSTSVSCSPTTTTVGNATVCTATVTDTGAGTAGAPTGTVELSPASASAGFGGSCTLSPGTTAGQATCQVSFLPMKLGVQPLSAAYGGDQAHADSAGSTTVTVTGPSCSLRATSTKLAKHGAKIPMTVTCNEQGTLKVTAVASIAKKGKHRASKVTAGTVSATVVAGRAVTLTIKPSKHVLSSLRTAAKNKQRISLKLSLAGTFGTFSPAKASASVSRLSVSR